MYIVICDMTIDKHVKTHCDITLIIISITKFVKQERTCTIILKTF